MLVDLSTELETSPARAWETVQRVDTLQYITRGLLGFRPLGGDPPHRLVAGDAVRVKLVFFHVIPAWRHEIRIVRMDEAAREIETDEGGGPVRTWRHTIRIRDGNGPARSRYTDRIEIEAGVLTPFVWAYAQLFYRYRQRRWRKLARSLSR